MDLSASDATAPSPVHSGAGHDAGERLAVEQPVHDALREALRGRRARAARELQQPRHLWAEGKESLVVECLSSNYFLYRKIQNCAKT